MKPRHLFVRGFCFLGLNNANTYRISFQTRSELPTEDLDGKEVIVLNPCDGWHIGYIQVDKDEDDCFIGIYYSPGEIMRPHSFYVAWALLPDGIALSDKFEGEQYLNRHCCVCERCDHSTAEHK
ncbi:hypothetical protein AB7360_03305 [Providencia alcalifaciens]|uniref:hypothetical protein n=1 Tax=Providencia TaxID=586 RepID=UPI001CFE30C4|nr:MULTISPECIES: hypothetical protein [Providencia]MCB4843422.1 hypothetical protein [Providencia rettgeri]MCG5278169.1 hypothetical protein [Providencia rettgeri]MCG9509392.1 hypothetical protein [Providencia rettgeri]MCY0801171.1 hypothetical protein [Providencia rettgeri]